MTIARAAAVAAGLMLSVALSGCGRVAGEASVASAADPATPASASASPGGGTVAAYVEAQRRWVSCLREHGLDAPDPDAKGRVDMSQAFPGGRKDDPAALRAQDACKAFSVEVPAELVPDREPSAQQLARLQEYSRCMRDNGMPDYPDPDGHGQLPAGWGHEQTPQEAAANIRAIQICDPVLSGRPKGTPDPARTGQG